jgi:hypothetical protein
MILLVLKILFFGENIIENNTLLCEKISKHCSKGTMDNSHLNLISLKLNLNGEPNRITNSTNSEAELFYDKVDKTELSLVK